MLWWSVLDGQHRWEQVASLAKQLPRNHEKTWVRKRIIKVTNIHYQHFGSQLLNKRLLLLPSQAAPKPSLPGVSAWVCFKASTHGADLAAFITDFCCFTAYKRSKEVGSDPHSRKHGIFPALWKPPQEFWCRHSLCPCTFSMHSHEPHRDPSVEILLTDSRHIRWILTVEQKPRIHLLPGLLFSMYSLYL